MTPRPYVYNDEEADALKHAAAAIEKEIAEIHEKIDALTKQRDYFRTLQSTLRKMWTEVVS